MVSLLAGVIGVGVETADLLVHEVLSRNLHGWKREREKAIFCRDGCGWMRLCEGSHQQPLHKSNQRLMLHPPAEIRVPLN